MVRSCSAANNTRAGLRVTAFPLAVRTIAPGFGISDRYHRPRLAVTQAIAIADLVSQLLVVSEGSAQPGICPYRIERL